jgi:serine acetyltransferase
MDFNRYTGQWWNPVILIWKMFTNPGMIFSVFYRFERYFLYESNLLFKLIGVIFYPVYFIITYYILSYHIEPKVKIGGGFMLHNRDIIMTENVTIGKNFTCMGHVTIGRNFNSEKVSIKIKDNVLLGTGTKIIASGDFLIEEGIVIGANGVVTKSLTKKMGVYAGVPVKLIKVQPKRA